jgi:hypothetical protein
MATFVRCRLLVQLPVFRTSKCGAMICREGFDSYRRRHLGRDVTISKCKQCKLARAFVANIVSSQEANYGEFVL